MFKIVLRHGCIRICEYEVIKGGKGKRNSQQRRKKERKTVSNEGNRKIKLVKGGKRKENNHQGRKIKKNEKQGGKAGNIDGKMKKRQLSRKGKQRIGKQGRTNTNSKKETKNREIHKKEKTRQK